MANVRSETEPRDELRAISALGEPSRRALYDYIVDAGDWVSRDQAADAVGLERATAAHHLDRLAADGLLEVDFQRLTGRQGPGAGRPAKLYRRARRDFELSLPPRDYALAGQMLAEAAERARTGRKDIVTALDEVATNKGEDVADKINARLGARGARRSAASKRKVVLDVLEEEGYEPRARRDGTIVLRNCPFHRLAQQHTELICGMNHCLLSAAVDAVDGAGLEARLDPEEGLCCVKLHPAR